MAVLIPLALRILMEILIWTNYLPGLSLPSRDSQWQWTRINFSIINKNAFRMKWTRPRLMHLEKDSLEDSSRISFNLVLVLVLKLLDLVIHSVSSWAVQWGIKGKHKPQARQVLVILWLIWCQKAWLFHRVGLNLHKRLRVPSTLVAQMLCLISSQRNLFTNMTLTRTAHFTIWDHSERREFGKILTP